tara:strand:- start:114 stop:350 length:237 start_codon:yes stop_codon:yes gene_type:complete
MIKKRMENLIENRIANLKGRRAYEEKKAAKLGFSSLYEYFEDKIRKEEIEKEIIKTKKLTPISSKKINKKQSSCGCCN